MNRDEKEMTKTGLILASILIAVIGFLIWYGATREIPEQNKIKQCEHWVLNYHYRGRMNQDVICADSLYITDRGEYKPLPPHLKELQDEITKQYHFLLQRKSLVNRDDLFPNREE